MVECQVDLLSAGHLDWVYQHQYKQASICHWPYHELDSIISSKPTSTTGPCCPPSSCISSIMNSPTACTALRCFHLRVNMSHCCGLASTRWLSPNRRTSVVVSPARRIPWKCNTEARHVVMQTHRTLSRLPWLCAIGDLSHCADSQQNDKKIDSCPAAYA